MVAQDWVPVCWGQVQQRKLPRLKPQRLLLVQQQQQHQMPISWLLLAQTLLVYCLRLRLQALLPRLQQAARWLAVSLFQLLQ
jgi:hypothetical protein